MAIKEITIPTKAVQVKEVYRTFGERYEASIRLVRECSTYEEAEQAVAEFLNNDPKLICRIEKTFTGVPPEVEEGAIK